MSRGRAGSRRSSRPRHRRRHPGWWIAGTVAVAIAVPTVAFVVSRRTGIERFCGTPDDLRTANGVTLQAGAMAALDRAENRSGVSIDVVQSYRSCRQQALACERICGSRQGCPGRCAPPGLSWHQRGLAIDVTQQMLDTSGVVAALEASGWCQPLRASDPGHLSYEGCH